MESKNEFNKAWAGAHAEKPLRDIAREEDVTPEEKSVIDGIAVRRGEKAMEGFENGDDKEASIEEKRQELANIVKEKLEKFQDEIKLFALTTTSGELNGFYGTSRFPWLGYDDRSKPGDYELFGVDPEESNYPQNTEIGYVKHRKKNIYTFVHKIGRTLHTPSRGGNSFLISLGFKEGSPHEKEISDSIMALFETLKSYEAHNSDSVEVENRDLAEIAKQGIPVLEAFEDTWKKIKPEHTDRLNITDLIREYKKLYEDNKSAL